MIHGGVFKDKIVLSFNDILCYDFNIYQIKFLYISFQPVFFLKKWSVAENGIFELKKVYCFHRIGGNKDRVRLGVIEEIYLSFFR